MPQEQLVSLDSLCQGALAEKFEYALQEVLANIADPNTNPCKMREIKISIKIKPDMKREFGSAFVNVTTTRVPDEPVSTTLVFEKAGNTHHVSELSQRYEQTNLLEASRDV